MSVQDDKDTPAPERKGTGCVVFAAGMLLIAAILSIVAIIIPLWWKTWTPDLYEQLRISTDCEDLSDCQDPRSWVTVGLYDSVVQRRHNYTSCDGVVAGEAKANSQCDILRSQFFLAAGVECEVSCSQKEIAKSKPRIRYYLGEFSIRIRTGKFIEAIEARDTTVGCKDTEAARVLSIVACGMICAAALSVIPGLIWNKFHIPASFLVVAATAVEVTAFVISSRTLENLCEGVLVTPATVQPSYQMAITSVILCIMVTIQYVYWVVSNWNKARKEKREASLIDPEDE